jgi:hypothetical protein
MKSAVLLFVALATMTTSVLAAKLQVASITPAQLESIEKSLQANLKNKKISTALAQASETITEFMKIESCISGYNASPLNRFAAPGKVFADFNYIGPMLGMKSHSRDACLTVTRMHGFEMPTKNTLSFEAVFAAEDSGEMSKRYYTLQQQPDASWLFK